MPAAASAPVVPTDAPPLSASAFSSATYAHRRSRDAFRMLRKKAEKMTSTPRASNVPPMMARLVIASSSAPPFERSQNQRMRPSMQSPAKTAAAPNRSATSSRYPAISRWIAGYRLEVALLFGAAAVFAGLCIDGRILWFWLRSNGGALDEAITNLAIMGGTLLALGVEVIFSAFFLSILKASRERRWA